MIFLSALPLGALTLNDYKSDAEANLFYGDFFHAFRSYNYIETEKPAYFEKQALDGYLRSLFIIGTKKTIESECDRLAAVKDPESAKAQYLCGKYFVENKSTTLADKYLSPIPKTSHFYWPTQILRATNSLISNEPATGLKYLNQADIKMFEKFGLADEFNLASARLFAAENKFDDSIKKYQTVDSKSPLYIEALEETAWVFFKMRRFESSQVLLDVLAGNYESAQRLGNQKISDSTYYRARYLRAYLALADKRTEGAATAFSDLKSDYEKNLIVIKPTLSSEDILNNIRETNQKWTDINNLPDELTEQLGLISEWEGAEVRKDFEAKIFYQMALTREINRARRFQNELTGESAGYLKSLESLQAITWNEFAMRYDDTLKKLSKDLDTLKIKAELGRLEIVWLRRAEGARSLDEVIENYRQETRSADEFMEK